MWMSADDNTAKTIENPYEAPLRFKLDRSCFHMGWHDQCDAYLVIDYRGNDFDVAAAERQIALLVGYLEDILNLDEVPPALVGSLSRSRIASSVRRSGVRRGPRQLRYRRKLGHDEHAE